MTETTLNPATIIDVNLLPRSRRPAEVSPKLLVGSAALAIAILGLVPLSLHASNAREDAAAAQQRAEGAEQQLASLQVDLTQVRTLRTQIDGANTRRAAIEAELAAIRGGTRPLGEDLARFWSIGLKSANVVLTRVEPAAEGSLSVIGSAPGPLDAVAYAQNLEASGEFPSARMVSFAPAADGAGEFTIVVTR
jgi:hypothetical protein